MGFFRKLNRPVTMSIGMFDLFKGIAMLLIVFIHNRSLFPSLETNKISFLMPVYIFIASFVVAIMPALFVLYGYSIRKRKIRKSFLQLLKELVKPYCVTAILSVLLNCIVHFSIYRYLPGAVDESIKLLAGMVLGSSKTVQIGSFTIFANGPIWFFLALFWASIIFITLLNYVDEKYISYFAFSISLLGWALSYLPVVPFCLSQGMNAVIYIYLGYYLRQRKVLTTSLSIKRIGTYAGIVVIPNFIFVALGYITNMADNIYPLGPVTYIENGLLSVGLIYFFMRTDDLCKGKISNALRLIGRYSLYFLCIHSIEMVVVPWYALAEKYMDKPILGFVLIYCLRLGLIFCGCFIVVKYKKFVAKKRT